MSASNETRKKLRSAIVTERSFRFSFFGALMTRPSARHRH